MNVPLDESLARQRRFGVACGLGAHMFWGTLAVMFFKQVERLQLSSFAIVSHRTLWSMIFALIALAAFSQLGELKATFRNRRTALRLTIAALLIGGNWLLFIHAVTSHQLLQASLGYFMTPLVNVVLGVTFLGEKVRPRQMISIVLAVASISILTYLGHALPWIAILLSASFGLYGLVRKTTPVKPLIGLAAETIVLLPLALLAIGITLRTGPSVSIGGYGLLIASGIVTAFPLLLFAAAARVLTLITLGLIQYIGPVCQLSMAVLVYHESFSTPRLIAFALIWLALINFTLDAWLHHRKINAPPEPL